MTNKKNVIIFRLIFIFNISFPRHLFANGEQYFNNLRITLISINSGEDPLAPSVSIRAIDDKGEPYYLGVWFDYSGYYSSSYQNIGTEVKLKRFNFIINVVLNAYALGDFITIYRRPTKVTDYYQLLQINRFLPKNDIK